MFSPRSYRRQKAIAADNAAEKEIIGSIFLPPWIYPNCEDCMFQDFVFEYFKQEQLCSWDYRLLNLFLGGGGGKQIKNHNLMFS